MDTHLKFELDREADILYINRCAPYAEQESEELGDDVVVRLNPETREIENLEVLFFSKRLSDSPMLDLPVDGIMRVTRTA
ncbi:MAG: DUF2283 domain-containing protein [Acidobacteriaceae bacterium]